MILIDPPNAAGHGRLWSHLASDTSYDELHAFARLLGVPERGFDRDHYDVPAQWYPRVVELGATPVTSRELIVRLRSAGLRRRKSEVLRPRAPGRGLLRPPVLVEGDVVAVVAPAGPADPDRLEAGADVLRGWGLQVRPAVAAGGSGLGWLAAPDPVRAAALVEAFLDPGVAAVWCTRGGFGSARLVELVDWHALSAAVPKPLVGFSDVTALHQAFAARLGLSTVHGPVLTSIADRDEATRSGLRSLLFDGVTGPVAGTVLRAGDEPGGEAGGDGGEALGGGAVVEGPLVGGNLTVLASLAGAPLVHSAVDSIAVLEDIGERPYRLDRALTQLLRSGWFEGVRGVVCGEFTDCGDPDEVVTLLRQRLSPLGVPVLVDAPIGHAWSNVALPLGARARLDGTTGVLTVESGR